MKFFWVLLVTALVEGKSTGEQTENKITSSCPRAAKETIIYDVDKYTNQISEIRTKTKTLCNGFFLKGTIVGTSTSCVQGMKPFDLYVRVYNNSMNFTDHKVVDLKHFGKKLSLSHSEEISAQTYFAYTTPDNLHHVEKVYGLTMRGKNCSKLVGTSLSSSRICLDGYRKNSLEVSQMRRVGSPLVYQKGNVQVLYGIYDEEANAVQKRSLFGILFKFVCCVLTLIANLLGISLDDDD